MFYIVCYKCLIIIVCFGRFVFWHLSEQLVFYLHRLSWISVYVSFFIFDIHFVQSSYSGLGFCCRKRLIFMD